MTNAFNLFILLGNKAMEIFSKRARNKNKYTFVTVTKVCKTEEGKRIF